MKELLDSIIAALEARQPAVLVGIIANSGSTPRGAGAMMAVFGNGSSTGTIGGGAVEYEAQKQAMIMFDTKCSQIASYTLAKNDIADLGMICGGDVTVNYEYIDPSEPRSLDLYKHMRSALDKNENAWVVRRFESGKPPETAVFDESGLHFGILVNENEISPMLGNAPVLTGNEIQYYAEPLKRVGIVYVFGAGHVAQELVPLLARAEFTAVVYDERDTLVKPELFPDASAMVRHAFTRIGEKLSVGGADYVVIMTSGHQNDFEVLDQMLRTQARYIGCIGSRKKLDATKQRLVGAGVPESSFQRLYSPIGLKIKAETPFEIAVSIAAEMINFRAENT